MFSDSHVTFLEELYDYGLDEVITSVFHQVQSGKESLQWSLKGVPNVDFYQKLHPFLQKWSITHGATKVAIGKFYVAIDKNLKEKRSRVDNVYRFIERVAKSRQSSDNLMTYGPDSEVVEVKVMRAEMKHCTEQVEQLNVEVIELKQQLEASRKQLQSSRCALRDVTNEKLALRKQRDIAERKAVKFQEFHSSLEDDIAQMQEDNIDLSMAISALKTELASISSDTSTCTGSDVDFSIQTKCGRRYSPAIRKLYYTLANQVPTSKIADIKTVLRCFSPSTDVQRLKLPQQACASYMRREELKTVSNAHKATVLCEHAAGNKGFRMNTDGTTKKQKKLGGIAINDMVVSVNELPDGTAMSAIDDISRELEKLRNTAHALKMPNPDGINWTLLFFSTSDSAATQKRLNKLIEECKADEKKIGPATLKTVDLIETFCSMHLGVNLRKAFLGGIVKNDSSDV